MIYFPNGLEIVLKNTKTVTNQDLLADQGLALLAILSLALRLLVLNLVLLLRRNVRSLVRSLVKDIFVLKMDVMENLVLVDQEVNVDQEDYQERTLVDLQVEMDVMVRKVGMVLQVQEGLREKIVVANQVKMAVMVHMLFRITLFSHCVTFLLLKDITFTKFQRDLL